MRSDNYPRRRAVSAYRRAVRRGNATLAAELAAVLPYQYRGGAR